MNIYFHSVYTPLGHDNRWQLDMFRDLAQRDRNDRHHVCDTPEAADAILVVDVANHLDGFRFAAVKRDPIVKRFRDKAFAWVQSARPPCVIPGLYSNVERRHWVPELQQPCGYFGERWVEQHEPVTHQRARHLFSFRGSLWTHPVRSRLRKLNCAEGRVVETSGTNWYSPDRSGLDELRQAFIDDVAESKFVLCPRGTGTNSFRLYEVLALGRVPVIISDQWVPTPGPDWAECCVRVPERDIDRIPDICRQYEARFPDMAIAARDAFVRFFAADQQFHQLGESLAALAESRTNAPRAVMRKTGALYDSWSLQANSWARRRLISPLKAVLKTARNVRPAPASP